MNGKGNKEELEKLAEELKKIDLKLKNALQTMLQVPLSKLDAIETLRLGQAIRMNHFQIDLETINFSLSKLGMG